MLKLKNKNEKGVDRMKIAIFSDSFLPGIGGTERATLGLASALAKNNNEVVVCVPEYAQKAEDNYDFQVIRTPSLTLTKNDNLAFPKLSKKLKKTLNTLKPDIIHCQTVSPMTQYALDYGEKNGIPVLMTVHTKFKTAYERSIKFKPVVNSLLKKIVKRANRADKVCVVSNDMIDELKSYGYDGAAQVVRNGSMYQKSFASEEKIAELKQKYGIKDDEKILLYVGYMVKYKNLEFVFNSLNNIKEQNQKFKAIFVGGGMDYNYFVTLSKTLGLEENVIFTGPITNDVILSSLYKMADLFVFPSIFDNDPLVIVEAAVNGVPAITLEKTGASERIENGVSGFIVENDLEKFTQKILEALEDEQQLKIMGQNASKLIPKTWDQTAQEYLQIYKEMISNKK